MNYAAMKTLLSQTEFNKSLEAEIAIRVNAAMLTASGQRRLYAFILKTPFAYGPHPGSRRQSRTAVEKLTDRTKVFLLRETFGSIMDKLMDKLIKTKN